MQNALNFPPPTHPEADVNPTFNVVIAYEDFEAGKQAKKTYDYIVEHLGNECVFSNQMWKFDVLSVPKLREMAAKDAVAADIIIVAARGTGDLPLEVKMWVESWLLEMSRAIALVGLFGEESADTSARNYLANVARRGGMEFFAQPGLWPELTNESSGWERNEKTFSLLAGVVRQNDDVSHWGINE